MKGEIEIIRDVLMGEWEVSEPYAQILAEQMCEQLSEAGYMIVPAEKERD